MGISNLYTFMLPLKSSKPRYLKVDPGKSRYQGVLTCDHILAQSYKLIQLHATALVQALATGMAGVH